MRILVLCTGNRCRSQMVQGVLEYLNPLLEVHSAGVKPAEAVHPLAISVMKEIGIDISLHYPKSVNQYLDQSWDYVLTVCSSAKESCPIFRGKVKQQLHIGFEDPDAFVGTTEEQIQQFRSVRDRIITDITDWYKKELQFFL